MCQPKVMSKDFLRAAMHTRILSLNRSATHAYAGRVISCASLMPTASASWPYISQVAQPHPALRTSSQAHVFSFRFPSDSKVSCQPQSLLFAKSSIRSQPTNGDCSVAVPPGVRKSCAHPTGTVKLTRHRQHCCPSEFTPQALETDLRVA